MEEASFVGRPARIKPFNSPTYTADQINYLLQSHLKGCLDQPKRGPALLPFIKFILHNELWGGSKFCYWRWNILFRPACKK
jgi:hypothetical protein